jgi:DNA mismatch repair protein MutL
VVAERLAVAARHGTTVEVQDLFFNTPARLKFLKHPRTELAMILKMLGAIALAHPGVRFHVTHDGKPVLSAPRVSRLRDRLGALYGFDLAGKLLDVEGKDAGMQISGLITPPQLARGNRDEITLIVNGRPVRDTLLGQTLTEAYRPLLARDQFPLAAISLAVPPQEVDVNVHPTKAWVRFRAPRMVQEALFIAVQSALRSAEVVQRQGGLRVPGGEGDIPSGPVAAETLRDYGAAGLADGEPQGRLFEEAPAPGGRDLFGTVVGQLQDTFIVSASEEEVFFVDQHVAHERVIFERLKAELAGAPLGSQELLFPEPLELARGQADLLLEWRETLAQLGFTLEGFGGGTVLLRAVPTLLAGHEPRRLVERLVDEVGAPAKEGAAPLLDRALSFVACRAAIKAPAPLERDEMRRLLTDLSGTETPYFCPHGRPIVSRLSLREIKRELRRTW